MSLIPVQDLKNEPNAVATMDDFKDPTNPKYIGPGTWNTIHRLGVWATTPERQLIFIQVMTEICHGFPCTICRGHCGAYIDTHPMEEYLNILVEIDGQRQPLGMFVWSWKFHNAVNARLRKPIMSWDTAYNMYSDNGAMICSKDCAEADDIPPDGLEHGATDSMVPSVPEPQVREPLPEPQQFTLVNF